MYFVHLYVQVYATLSIKDNIFYIGLPERKHIYVEFFLNMWNKAYVESNYFFSISIAIVYEQHWFQVRVAKTTYV